jgi:hypothetical protein
VNEENCVRGERGGIFERVPAYLAAGTATKHWSNVNGITSR